MSCTSALAEIARLCGVNLSGNTEVYVANYDEVDAIPAADADSHTVSTDITFKTGGRFYKYNFTKKSCEHKEDEIDDSDGQVNGTVEMFFPKDDDDKRYMFMDMAASKEFCLLVKDANGEVKLIPNCEFKRNYTSGKGAGDGRNGFTGTFYYDGQAAFLYTGAISETAAV